MPSRATKDLTDYRVKNARPTDSQYEVFDRSVGGFALRVAPSGSKSYVVNYRCNGKGRRMTIGDAAGISLADARAAATAAKAQAKSGIDPLDEKRREREALRLEEEIAETEEEKKDSNTFAAVADLFIQRYAKGMDYVNGKSDTPRKKSWKQDHDMLQKYVVPVWGSRQINELVRSDVADLLDPIEAESGLHTANRVLACVRKLFNWAMLRGTIEVTPIIIGMARGKEKPRERVLTEDEIRSFWKATGSLGYPFGHLYRLLLATGQRRNEVTTMQWSQLDLDQALWTIPSYSTKANRGDHIVPLNDPALEIIADIPRIEGSDLLFPTSSNATRAVSGFSKAKARCDKLSASKEFVEEGMVALSGWRLHDLRRTMGTIMDDDLGIAPHILGAVLNHDPKSYKGITAVYSVGKVVKHRRGALDAWGRKLQSILAPGSDENVLPLKKAEQ